MTRILFLEDSRTLSGSAMSLCHLLASLDYQQYEAYVVLSRNEQYEFLRSGPPLPITCKVISRGASLQRLRVVSILARFARSVHASIEHLFRTAVALLDLIFVTLPYCARLAWFCRGKHIDLIHHNNGFYEVLVLLGWLLRVPVVAYQRGPQWSSPTVRYWAQYITLYCANSEATRADLLSIGIAPERIRVVYPPVDLRQFAPPGDLDDVLREFGLDTSRSTFGIVGLLTEWKGQAVFLRAAHRVLGALPRAKAFIIGGAPKGGEAYEHQLRTLARDLGIDDRVVFTGFRNDVPALLNMLDVVVHASLRPEPFGRVIVEAMAMGKPVIASRAGGPLEIIRSGDNGFLVPPGDAAALAEKITQLLRERDLAERIGQKARSDAARRFSVVAHVTAMQEIYSMVLDGSSISPPEASASKRA